MNGEEVIWVTGASTGIGRALVIELASRGHKVLVSARNKTLLHTLAKNNKNIVPIVFDVTQESDIDSVRQHIEAVTPYIDRVILNAGTCEYLDTAVPDWMMMQRVMAVNYFGSINSLAVAMPLLKALPEGRRGHIVGIVSLAVMLPFPRAEAYGASKAAMHYFLDSLRLDLAYESIDVTVVNPGFVATPLTDKNDFPMPFLVSAGVAAQRIATAISRRPRQYDFPRRLKWSLKLLGLFPGIWDALIAPKNYSS